jgi:ERCC4-type nuclease
VIILIDTREQLPLEFCHPYVEGTQRESLPVGDYAVRYKDGHVPGIIFERKSIPDLFGSLSKGYKRFKRELMKAKQSNKELIIIIEGTTQNILDGTPYSQVDGLRILRTLLSLYDRYQISHVFCRDRREMAVYVAEMFCARGRTRAKGNKWDIKQEKKD